MDISNTGVPGSRAVDVFIEASGSRWFAIHNVQSTQWDGGFAHLQNNIWSNYKMQNSGLGNNAANCFTIDQSGNQWMGTDTGVFVYDGVSNWTHYSTANTPMTGDIIIALYTDASGKIWVGTYQNGVYTYDGTWTSYTTGNSGINNDGINNFLEDGLGGMWIGTDNGLSHFDGSTWTNYTTVNSNLQHPQVTGIDYDSQGNLWVATFGGLCMFDGAIMQPQTTVTQYLSCMRIDNNDNIWIGLGFSNGLVRQNSVDTINYTTSTSDIPSNVINDIEIEQDTVWVATSQGIAKLACYTYPACASLTVNGDDALCYNSMDGIADVIVQGGYGETDILWSTGETTTNISNLDTGWYYLSVTDETGCISIDSIYIDQADSLSSAAISTDEMNGADGSIDLTVNGGTPPYSYTWTNGAGTNEDPTNLIAGSYTVTITDINGCEDTLTVTVGSQVGISSFTNDFLLYPNPSSGVVNISNSSTIMSVRIYNAIGQRVLNNTEIISGTLDLSSLNNGIYTLQLIDAYEKTRSIRVIINK